MKYNETIMYKEINEQASALNKMRDTLSDELIKIKNAVTKNGVTNVVTAARGSSNNACTYFKYLCEIYCSLPVSSSAPGVLTMYNGKLKYDSKTLCIGVSQSGKAADAIRVMQQAKLNGAVTVAITNNCDSPMAKAADFHLFLGVGEEKSVAATKTFTAQMFVFLLLSEVLSGDRILTNAIKNIPNGIKTVLTDSEKISQTAIKLKDLQTAFILGRGLNYCAALESCLKMQETTYTMAKAYPSSDFHHGPFAMVDKNSTVFLIMPKGESFKDLSEMKDKCEKAEGRTIVYTDSNIKGNFDTITIPSGTDIETPFYSVVATQLLVNSLSVLRGISPDAPRGLNKITITV